MLNWLAVRLGAVLALFGVLMSRPMLLDWLSTESAETALLVWYFAFAVLLAVIGFTMLGGGFNLRHLAALICITWALGIVLYLPISDYSVEHTGATVTAVEAATEDQVTYRFLTETLGIPDSEGYLTYGVIPFLLIVLAGSFIAPSMFGKLFGRAFGRS